MRNIKFKNAISTIAHHIAGPVQYQMLHTMNDIQRLATVLYGLEQAVSSQFVSNDTTHDLRRAKVLIESMVIENQQSKAVIDKTYETIAKNIKSIDSSAKMIVPDEWVVADDFPVEQFLESLESEIGIKFDYREREVHTELPVFA